MSRRSGSRYVAPTDVHRAKLADVLGGRSVSGSAQQVLGFARDRREDDRVWYAGDISLVEKRAVAVVGSRDVSPDGAARARRLARELAEVGVVVVSGLARGVDTEALSAALEAGGRVVGVIGTPLEKATPIGNARLQQRIYREHLLVSQFEPGSKVYPANFPRRNRLMAAMTDATVIVEAGDKSGALHQAAECRRLDRWLFIMRSLAENPDVTWPAKWIEYERTSILDRTEDALGLLG